MEGANDTSTKAMAASVNLLRRLPAKDVPKNLAAIGELIEDE